VAVTEFVEDLAELAEQRHRDPAALLRRALDVLTGAPDFELEATARWIAGLALHELGRVPDAVGSYHQAIEIGARYRFRAIESQARAGLAVSLVSAGEPVEAAVQIRRARRVATPATRGVVEMLYGLIQQRRGHLTQAQTTYGRALGWLEEKRESVSIARLRLNRGILRAYRGDFRGALEDLTTAEQIATRQQLPVLSAMAAHNLGFAYGRRGDLPAALGAFSRAERAYRTAAAPEALAAVLEADRCEVLLVAGLVPEARMAAERAVETISRTSDRAYLAECQLLLARALLAGQQFDAANALASAVAEHLRAAGRLPWAALAESVAIQAEVHGPEIGVPPAPDLLGRAQRVARQLDGQGWSVEAAHVRLFIGQVALSSGQPDLARAELLQTVTSRCRGTADRRAQSWYATALLRMAEGDRRAAKVALSRGLQVVDEHVATLGATELRARAAGYGSDLARLGARMAVEQRHPTELLRWAERWRAASLHHPPARPPEDDHLVGELAEWRRLRDQLHQAALAGRPRGRLERQARSTETAIRRRLLEVRGAQIGRRPLDTAQLKRRLDNRVLVEYVDLDDRLYAVTVTPARSRLFDVGPLGPIQQELSHLLFAFRRSLRARDGGGAVEPLVSAAANRLDQLLVAPLGLGQHPQVVIAPPPSLQRLPWGRLPGLEAREITLAPSAAMWMQARDRPMPGLSGSGALLVAGPGLPGAEQEVHQLAALYPDARQLRGEEATVSRVLDGLGQARMVHLAAHGTFRGDSPLFSSFQLADGPLTVHDLERAEVGAETVVLAACHAGVSGVIGNELIGTTATLLAMGVGSIIAPLVAVPDLPTSSFMVEIHRSIQAGRSPAAALAEARSGQHGRVASAFVCLGRDDRSGVEPGRGDRIDP
jgi:tetratricopeptide (TPR) repeat protein